MIKTILTLTVVVALAWADEWAYSGPKGPANWQGECKKKSQSPIDIPRNGAEKQSENPFVFVNYDRTPEEAKLLNNGHTVKYSAKYKDGNMPTVSGGGLPETFEFAQFHMHWATRDNKGSEHTISQVSYPMELHLVHFNTGYGADIADAIAKGAIQHATDSLAVLGIMFQLQSKNNSKLDPIINALSDVPRTRDEAFTALFPLNDLLPKDTTGFYRYNGSLTTPGCNEIVVWTVFKEPISISNRQMAQFRSLMTSTPTMKDNYRPTLPLNGRKILDITTTAGAEKQITNAFITMAVIVVAKILS